MKKRIGLVPPMGPKEEMNLRDHYTLGMNYAKRVAEAGCIPVGLAPVDPWIPEEILALCDGFLVQGGKDFSPHHFQVIHHAIIHGKRLLGICLGHQLIYAYLELKRRVEKQGFEGDLPAAIWAYIQKQGPGFSVLLTVPGHRSPIMPRGNEDVAKHDVAVVPGTLLHRVLGTDTMRIATFHDLCIPPDQTLVTVNAWHGDVAEGVEYGENILGVQGHPEVDTLLPELFVFLAN